MRMNFLFLSGFLVSESNVVMNEKEDRDRKSVV